MKALFRNDQAVSETIGYILIFGIVMTCIGIIAVTGNQVIADTEERNSFQGIEQSFTVLSSDLKKTALESTPLRTMMIKFDLGSMNSEHYSLEMVVKYPGSPDYTYDSGTILYNSNHDGQGVSIENGAVITRYGTDSSMMSRPPRMYYSPDTGTLMISAINITCGHASIGGPAICTVRMMHQNSSIYDVSSPTPRDVIISIKSDCREAWKSYLINSLGGIDEPSADPQWVSVKIPNTKRVAIVTYNVTVDLK